MAWRLLDACARCGNAPQERRAQGIRLLRNKNVNR